MIEVIIF